ncbi:MAG TPA: DUF2141 domain-containing protein [Myxococcota bacterium]|nr:DUF2141 domain-containing protein [Myxococcota bacterium]
MPPTLLRALFLLLTCASLSGASSARASTLEIAIQGLESDAGDVEIEVFGSAQRATFPYAERGVVAEIRIGARALVERGGSVTLPDLAPGRYAVAVVHDANANGDMDFDFLGLPAERYGFSNGAHALLGPPSFDDAAVRVTPAGVTRADVQLAR